MLDFFSLRISHFPSFRLLVPALAGLSSITPADVLGDARSWLGVAGGDIAAAGSTGEPCPPCCQRSLPSGERCPPPCRLSKRERGKTRSPCGACGGPTAGGSSQPEVRVTRPLGSGLGRGSLSGGWRTNSGVDKKVLTLLVVASLSSSSHSCLPVKVAAGGWS